ncbi:DNA topoisomerase I [Klebsormidium nitens]|uniref:DNA topoisomerase I n=1 Tax=Klebsormidium nitens TaxID=105231 RepID=A0A0U9HRA6_KLENI|nr:DNA topoisomerase I [Klebsormidium nitens]|eukprot:GAQ80759.1 DNA topoisomerase I [Klebsormidium nitens]
MAGVVPGLSPMEVDAVPNGAPAPSNGHYDSDDDDAPLVFKRHTPASPQLLKPPVQNVPQIASGGHVSAQSGVTGVSASKEESDSDDDVPLVQRREILQEAEHKPSPIAVQKKPALPAKEKQLGGEKNVVKKRPADAQKTQAPPSKKAKPEPRASSSDEDDDRPLSAVKASVKKTSAKVEGKKKVKVEQVKKPVKKEAPAKAKAPERKKAPKDGDENGTVKWTTLEHNGVIFPPPYQPHGVKMLYDGKPVQLTPEQEEVATFFAVMKDTDWAQKKTFVTNFWHDWSKLLGKKHVIQKLGPCDFTPIYEWHLQEKERKKSMTSEEKKRLKEEKLKAEEKYMFALVDGVKEQVGNFRVEPPGLFRGRGEHPKMGKVKKRIVPEDITLNIGKDAPIPECPVPGHKWGEIRHDPTVTWLAFWHDPISPKDFKYVFLAPSSSWKGQSDMEKYEKARKLKDYIGAIRDQYNRDLTSKNTENKQIAVAVYLIDVLALRAGNEKDEDEADTVGCCSLKIQHVKQIPPTSLEFDFLGKDSIRYFNTVQVNHLVYEAIGSFKKGKKFDDDLFDTLNTTKVNTHLKGLMPGLTAKVFRTYNASYTLDKLLVDTDGTTVLEKIASYQKANKEVAILCNHQRSVSKAHEGQMEKLSLKLKEAEEELGFLKEDLARARKGKPPKKRPGEDKEKKVQQPDAVQRQIEKKELQLRKIAHEMAQKDDLKTVALGTSKINYMDPRISVAWCKKHEVPIEKIFNKSLLNKFTWALEVEPEYRF